MWSDQWPGVDVVKCRLVNGSLSVWLAVYASSPDELYLYSQQSVSTGRACTTDARNVMDYQIGVDRHW